jgi:hypothetical protein
MSWQDYVTQQLVGKNLKEGAIAGKDGQICLPRTTSSLPLR